MGINKLSPYNSPYRTNSSELDLRKEFNDILYGSPDEVPKGRVGILRKMRRDLNGELVRCVCRDELSDSPSKDYYCRYCHGFGFFWDEKYITYFLDDDPYDKKATNDIEYNKNVIYVEHTVNVTDRDYIISIRTDNDGNAIIPVERLNFYKVYKATPYRSDFGRIEFFELRTQEEQKWSVWYGVKLRNGD